jgi:fibronectin-binding autotransporter adhesin
LGLEIFKNSNQRKPLMKTVNLDLVTLSKNLSLRFLLCASVALLSAGTAQAAAPTWNGTQDANWDNANNWSTGTVPTNADTATFNSAGNGKTSLTFSTASSVGSITFDTSSAAYTIGAVGSPTLTLTSAGTIQTTSAVSNAEIINEPLSLGGAYTFSSNAAAPDTLNIGGTVNLNGYTLTLTGTSGGNNTLSLAEGVVSGGTNTISGVISGTGGITKTTAGGLWVLTGANTYSGATTVTSGVLQIGNGTSGSIAAGPVSVGGTGILRFDEANGSTISNVITGSNGSIVVGSEGAGITNTLSGGITGATTTSFQQLGAGTTVISGTGNYTGQTSVYNGTLTFDYNTHSVSQINGTGKLIVAAGGTLNINGINGGTTTTTFGTTSVIGIANPTLGSLGGNENINFNSGTGGTLNVTLQGLGNQVGSTVNFTLPTSGTVSATGAITGTNGILETSAGGNTYATVGNDWAALTGGSATTSGNLVAGSSIGSFYTAATSTSLGSADNAQITGTTGTAVNLALTAATTVTSLQDNVAQATTITIGSSNATTRALSVGGILIGSGVGNNLTTIGSTANGTLNIVSFSGLSIFQDNTANGLTISALITGTSGTLSKNGPGLLTLSNTANTYAGPTDLNGGITNIAADGSLGKAPTTYVYFNGTNINIIDGATLQMANSFAISPFRGIVLGNGGGIIDTQGNTTTFNGIVSASTGGALTKAGTGTLILGGASTYSSATNITNGTLSIGNIGNAGTTQGIDVLSTGATGSITLLTTTGLVNGTTYTLSGNAQYANEGSSFTYAAGTTSYANPANQILGNGVFYIGVANALGLSTNASTNLTLGSATGATLQYTGATASTDRLFQLNNTAGGLTDSLDASGTGAINFTNTGAITYGTPNITETLNLTGTNTGLNSLAPQIGNNGTSAVNVTKTGAGSWTLSGANTYSGGTSVTAGTLVVANTTGSATGTGNLTVGANSTLAGTGTSSGSSFGINGSGTTATTTANVLVGHVSAADLNTTGVMNLVGTGASTISNANLTFNLSVTSPRSGNELNVGATNLTFNTLGSINTTVSLNMQGTGIISAFTPYALILGTGTTTFTGTSLLAGPTTGQFSGLSTFVNAQGLNQISDSGALGGLLLSFDDPVSSNFYGANSYLFLADTANGDEIEVEVVPEPSAWAMVVGGLAMLIFWQRRNKRA